MMYNNKLVVAIKANGRVLREFKDGVYVPYGSEYSILIKNLNSVRAVVNITIDGQSASGTGLAIEANTEIELQRFIKTDLNKGNRFKFIERTGKIEKHRGVKLEDGLIRVEFQFAKSYMLTTINPISGNWLHPQDVLYRSSVRSLMKSPAVAYASCSTPTMDWSKAQSEVGITVEGSQSNQKFITVSDVPMENEKHVMILRLLGETAENNSLRNPVTVSYVHCCQTCGTKNKAANKFCIECGTALHIHA